MKEIIGLIIFILLLYLYHFNKIQKEEESKVVSYKNILVPKIDDINNEFTELQKEDNNVLSKYLLKIQLYYYYNEEAYEEMVEELENFLILYRSINIDGSYGGIFYDLMQDKKRLMLNNLRSIGIKLPQEYKLESALNDLENILDIYLYKAEYLYKNYLQTNDYDYQTKMINRNQMASNQFEIEAGSFSYY